MSPLKTAVLLASALSACARAQPPVYASLPDFSMTAVGPETEAPFGRGDLLGKVWIAGFVYTSCGGPCPLITGRMAELAGTLPAGVSLLTVTVDPEGDTPERLRAYAKARQADPRRWVFLRGGAKATYELLYAGFRLPMSTDPSAPKEARVLHSTKLVLVDAAGSVRGYYDALNDLDAHSLARDARALLEVGPR